MIPKNRPLKEFKQALDGTTKLMDAARLNLFPQVQQYIKDGYNLNAADNAGNDALIYAVDNKREEISTVLMRNGANLNHVNKAGQNALIIAASKAMEMQAVIENWIVQKGPLDVQDKIDGDTALMAAIRAGDIWAADKLIMAGADFDKLRDNKNETAESLGRITFQGKDLEIFKRAIEERRTRVASEEKRILEENVRSATVLSRPIPLPKTATFTKPETPPKL